MEEPIKSRSRESQQKSVLTNSYVSEVKFYGAFDYIRDLIVACFTLANVVGLANFGVRFKQVANFQSVLEVFTSGFLFGLLTGTVLMLAVVANGFSAPDTLEIGSQSIVAVSASGTKRKRIRSKTLRYDEMIGVGLTGRNEKAMFALAWREGKHPRYHVVYTEADDSSLLLLLQHCESRDVPIFEIDDLEDLRKKQVFQVGNKKANEEIESN